MCVYSMVVDRYRDTWQPYIPVDVPTQPPPTWWPQPTVPYTLPPQPTPFTPDEVERFRKDMEEMRDWLKRAKKYDAANGEKDCDLDEKKEALQKLADQLGVPIEFP